MNLVLQHTHIALNKRGRLFSAGGRKKREKAEKLPVSVKKKRGRTETAICCKTL